MTNFKPDWSELEACQESLREHMKLLKESHARIQSLEQSANSEHALVEHERAKSARFKDLLRQIAYPRTDEDNMWGDDASNLIQSNFSLEELE